MINFSSTSINMSSNLFSQLGMNANPLSNLAQGLGMAQLMQQQAMMGQLGMAAGLGQALSAFAGGKTSFAGPFASMSPTAAMNPGKTISSSHQQGLFGTTSTDRVDLSKKRNWIGGAIAGALAGGPLGALAGGLAGKLLGRCKAKLTERRLRRDPAFRQRFEAKMGGRVQFDGCNDGKITVRRHTPNLGGIGLNPGAFASLGRNPMAAGVLGGLARMQSNIANLARGIGMGGIGGSTGNTMGNLMSGNTFGNMSANASMRSQGLTGGDFMSKLPANASFEDLIAALMMDVVKDLQEQIKQKADKLKEQSKGGGRGRRGGLGGLLGGVAKIGGGVLGGMVGGPIGAQAGSALGGAIGGGMGTGGQSGAGNADSRQLAFEELKNMMNKLQQMQQSLSNVLNTMHKGAMNAIQNIRG